MFKENAKKVETIIKTSEEPQSSRLNGFQRLKECCFIVGVLSSVLLAVALFTFSPADPSWSQTAWGGEIDNAGGLFGAWLADTLFFTFGSLAYPIPFLLAAAAWVICRKRGEDEPIDFMLWGTRLLGLTVLIMTSCGLADINFDDIWYFSSGGVVGDVLSSLALPTLNVLGTTLVLLFLWGAGFTLFTGISWLNIVEWLGDRSLAVLAAIANKFRGSEQETLEPQLDEFVEDKVSTKHVEDDQQDDETLPHLTAYEVEEPKEKAAVHEYPIYMPQAKSETPAVKPTPEPQPQRVAAVNATPTYVEPEPQLKAVSTDNVDPMVERTKQLNVTIEELEAAAQQADDWASEEQTSQSYADTNAVYQEQVQAKHEEVVEHDTPQRESSYEEYEQFAAQQEQQLHVEPTPHEEPVIDTRALDDITDHAEPSEHIEPTISDFDVVDEEEAYVAPQPQSRSPEPQPIVQPQSVSQIQPEQTPESSVVFEPAPQEVEVEEVQDGDQDVAAFQSMVSSAQAKVAATQNPFLMKQEQNLPVPEEPLPTLELLYHPEKRENFIDREALEQVARLVESKLADYKIKADVVGIYPGPVITRFELDLAPGVKVSRISGLSMDLARALSAMAVRVVEVIPGKPYVGLELPNMSRQTVYLSDVISSPQFEQAKSPTTVVLGQDIAGEAVIADIAKMPHVLVAGTTGSGKSVGVNVMILSMLYKASPEDLRFIMIDPKMLELSIYEGIPHLLAEVVTDMKDASNALRWCVGEMERRYKLMSALGVRNVKGFNEKLKMAAEAGHPIHDPFWQEGDSMDTEPPLLEKLPYIVVVVDEFADLMMVVGKKVEELIARLAQKARAAGIHLILATQRPSVDVITGLIKANIPTRVAFTVSTKTDSRTILDQGGAESLLGMGDMLYLPPGSSHTIRVHGAFASDDDVHAVVNNWKARGKPNYIDEIISGDQGPESLLPGEQMESDEEMDPLFDQVVEHVVQSRRGSVSGVQRRFKIGYNRAARIVEQLEAQGIVSAPGHNGNREVLAPAPPKD
ncbi:DNA translocase FtsK 4TM domain-containing protein [Vibrio parahaemolyticus]|uniref:DNA translocase FtsK 4TM domain-containing protein n=1 Tax=Vibrio parahaemolyticus TaxID=670 RepID=UPI0015C091F1|nr:DNA translocase FtsK 4TM domain-containing protein [Vibrio parahaemolyticus]QLE27809.1 DNA translocase FtsK [Vibrio parahaemolyticus]HCE1881001.1 DNA translocase FtsK 4TM domain-containing protein [Vibrio parahaemolyticus]HCE3645982.1 DNA translocase FtsK 4TM domain-containing protein [Vibrio parahaemolyticus]HCE3648504.1 DNA translocase FtsK 4TM domain-containing protein [Vibrio parahaemolyticus]HCE4536084.1 DNA translocase FtsK 4TM domain-containing protein [Vibrio parahaemolyticus]